MIDVASSAGAPRLGDYFHRATLGDLLRTRHPYDFLDTYVLLRHLFGYRSHYVNLGLWDEGPETPEPGRRLTFRVASTLGLGQGDCLLEVGSGLGQAAVDLTRHYALARATGINPNARQVAFANALARHEGMSDSVSHIVGDACESLDQFAGQGYTSVLAVECVGHFGAPDAFLEAAREVAGPGGRIAMCQNIAASELTYLQRGALRVAFGFTPASLPTWKARLQRAGFRDVRVEDLTEPVLACGLRYALGRLSRTTIDVGALVKAYVRFQLSTAVSSVVQGSLRYLCFGARAR